MDNEFPCSSQLKSFLIFPEKIGDMLTFCAKSRASQEALPSGQLELVTRCTDRDWRRAVMAITAKSVTGAHSAWLYEFPRRCCVPDLGGMPSLPKNQTERDRCKSGEETQSTFLARQFCGRG